MDPTTCPKFPWAIHKPEWGEGGYMSVTSVMTDFITVGNNNRISWKDLMDEGYTDQNGNLLRVEK